MKHNKFLLKNIIGKDVAIHCTSKKKAKKVISFLYSNGHKWGNDVNKKSYHFKHLLTLYKKGKCIHISQNGGIFNFDKNSGYEFVERYTYIDANKFLKENKNGFKTI